MLNLIKKILGISDDEIGEAESSYERFIKALKGCAEEVKKFLPCD